MIRAAEPAAGSMVFAPAFYCRLFLSCQCLDTTELRFAQA